MTSVRICPADEIELTSAVRVVIDDQPIALVKDSAGEIFAIGDTCTHGDISLSEGFVEDGVIECWAHGSHFSLRTGQALTLPAYEPVPVFTVTIVDGDVYIDPTPRFDYERKEA
ncbi:3-phenylpropionate/trans-cinnamate dioxygenase ferredoxin subunit [Cryobacterium mesophilum]|uniref:Non-heme iron oxygenase ferredoxin subunit n=1 Tax=Terrimesophilobacter mesophilus TaxID=433647 RepID=A0A4R8V953_9MICO|nr:non-heme iron oxygenase ferredoxin subunit [Terrimesophilobacter mesophilus]MBB5631944.1 3-phenylpropionate/trans-cinnamate dioxygenase ferredoxin subunit [Terrimesophilobacter mesophilus]TFB78846.1 non-heme iron oxygenase ferredoxin subunit [Terrimesophilobacter mesophilus]